MREDDKTYRPRDYVEDGQMCIEAMVSSSSTGTVQEASSPDPIAQRPGDRTFRPRQPMSAEDIKEENRRRTAMQQEKDKAAETATGSCELDAEPLSFKFLSFSLVVSIFVLSALALKFAFLLRDALALPLVVRELALAGIAVCLAVIAYAAITLARVFRRLPRIEQAARTDAAGREVRVADRAKILHKYLQKAFPDDRACDDYGGRIVHVEGCSGKLKSLRKDIDDYGEWMGDFAAFEKMQDDAAKACIIKRARWVFVKTGVSPWKFVDAMAVLYHSVAMTTEMAKIYRRRITRFQAFRLAVDGLVVVGVASVAQDMAEKTTDAIFTKIFEAGSKLISGIIGKVAAKTAEGSLNAALVYRLGRRMQEKFKPLVEKAEEYSAEKTRRSRTPIILLWTLAAIIVASSLFCRLKGSQAAPQNAGNAQSQTIEELRTEIKTGFDDLNKKIKDVGKLIDEHNLPNKNAGKSEQADEKKEDHAADGEIAPAEAAGEKNQ